MSWRIVGHAGFVREMEKLPPPERDRILAGLRRLASALADRAFEARSVALSETIPSLPGLSPLRGTRTPGSYRLRVGDWRIALTLLPDERVVLVTAAMRRGSGTYPRLPSVDEARFRSR